MPTVYLRKDHYDSLVKLGKDPTYFVNDLLDSVLVKHVEIVLKSENDGQPRQVELEIPEKKVALSKKKK